MKKDNSRQGFFIVLFAISLIAITFCGHFYYRNFKERYLFEVQNQLKSITSLKIEEIIQWKKERVGDAAVFVSDKGFSALIKSYLGSNSNTTIKKRIIAELLQIKTSYGYNEITVCDINGKELAGTSDITTSSRSNVEKVIESQLNPKKIQLIDFFRVPESGKIFLYISAPVMENDTRKKQLGVILFRIDPETYLYPFINKWPVFSKTAETLIFRWEGDSIVYLNNVKRLGNAALNLKKSLTDTDVLSVKAVKGETGVVYGTDYSGASVLAYISQLPGFPWYIESKIDLAEVLEPLKETMFIVVLLGLSLILGSGVSLRYLWRRQKIAFYREKYESEKMLREKQELYKTLINTLPQRILFKSTDSIYISCNNAFAQNFNIDPSEIAGKTDFDFFSPVSARKYIKEDETIKNNQQHLVIEEEFREKGEKKIFNKIKTPVLDEKGNLIGILCISEDVTKRKQNEAELSQSLEQLEINRKRLENSESIAHIASWEYDVATDKIWASNEGFKIFGLMPGTNGEMPIEDIEKCISERERVHQAMVDLLGEEKEYNLEYDVIPDNQAPLKTVISVAKLVKNSEGIPQKVIGFIQDVTEQRRIEKEIKESHTLFETVVNTSPSLIWMSGFDKSCFWFNDVWLKFTGRTLEQEIGNGWAEGVFKEDYNYCLNIYSNAFDKRENFEMEYRLRRYDGQFRWVLDIGYPRYDSENNFAGYIGSLIDITDRKNVEYLLSESEEKYRLLAETAKDIIVIQNLDGELLYMNAAGQNILGFSEENYFKKRVDSFISKKYDFMLTGFLQSRKDGFKEPRIYEIEFVDKKGISIPMEAISAPIIKDGEITGILSISRDITDRKRAESELKILNAELEARIKIRTEQLEKLNLALQQQIEERTAIERATAKYADEVSDLYNNAPCGYHSLDSNGVIIRINDTELKWLGYERSEIVNRVNYIDLFTDKSKDLFRKNFPVFKERGWVSDLEFDMIRKDGTIFSILLNATAVLNENGNYLMSRSTIFDITEIKKAKEEIELLNRELIKRANSLETANKELEAFAYSVSHDLRSPLRAINGFSKIMLEDYSNKLDPEGMHLLEVIRSSTIKMDQLIVDLLSLSKVTRVELKFIHMDMTAMVRTIYYEFTTEEERSKINFELSPLVDITGDPVLIRQVWDNLLSNAVKYTRTKAKRNIEIGSILKTGCVEYFVKDNGVGFDPEYQHKLFGVFQRLHNSDEFEGTGVGLAIVSRIVLRHGGRVWAKGAINEGAEFHFELPKTEQ
jgi:PAS domain S-box-containing protein